MRSITTFYGHGFSRPELTEVVLPYYPTDLVGRRALVEEAKAAWERLGGAGATPDARPLELGFLILEGAWAEAERRAHAALTTVHPTPPTGSGARAGHPGPVAR